MKKNVVYFFPTFSHIFMADDCQFSNKVADSRMLSVHAKRLITLL